MRPILTRVLRSPLLHFVVAGGCLFALALAFDPAPDPDPGGGQEAQGDRRARDAGASAGADGRCDPSVEADTIRVEREPLLAFIQSQTRMPRLEDAATAFDAAPAEVRRDWVDRFVREEALVREARRLGLDRSDELIRRRLVEQMEFLVEDVGAGALVVTEEEIEAAHRAQADAARRPATLRFVHVFVRQDGGTGDTDASALARARGLRDELNRRRIPFDGAYAWGDRFLYDRVYVDRTLDEVRSHFGEAFAAELEGLEPRPDRWVGPLRSEHGLHLVLLAARQPARAATLEEERAALRELLLREKRERAIERGVAAIVGRYRVELGGGLPASPARVRGPGSSVDSRHNIAPPPAS